MDKKIAQLYNGAQRAYYAIIKDLKEVTDNMKDIETTINDGVAQDLAWRSNYILERSNMNLHDVFHPFKDAILLLLSKNRK